MAVKKQKCFCLDVDDRPGVLADICRKLKAGKVNLKSVWGFGLGWACAGPVNAVQGSTATEGQRGVGGGKAKVFAVPQRADAFRKISSANGWNASECDVFALSGKDQVGALIKTLEAAEKAGANIHALDAIAVGGRFGATIWAAEGQGAALAKALGAK